MINLFENKKDCCGCGACQNACPKSAIVFKNDEYGFAYPEIDREKCIECGRCKTVCAFQNRKKENTPLEAYAACINDEEKIMRSTSGGAFAAIAESVLSDGGVVFGAALEKDKDSFTVRHIAVDNINNLEKILKSKYVQSQTGDCYFQAEQLLKDGKTVLYSGTPCQIAGLKGYLKKDYENLITADLVCHGVPSLELFRAYISQIEKRENIKIEDFLFRDKDAGWATQFRRIKYLKNDKSGEKSFDSSDLLYSYFELFKKYSLRENCYTCKYAGANRPADITLGDCWGIEKLFPDEISESDGKFDRKKGVSCVVLNTEKGIDAFNKASKRLYFKKSDFENIAAYNTQLKAPTVRLPERDSIMEIYRKDGYFGIEKRYRKILNKKKIKSSVKKLLPDKLIEKIKG